MMIAIGGLLALMVVIPGTRESEVDYDALWAEATPFHTFLENVKARRDQWHSRFANAAVEADALNAARALPARRRILIIAEDRCSDSAWTVPSIAKLAAAVPEKLELRIIAPAQGRRIQSSHLTPDGRMATPVVVILDELNRFIGAWVERPTELQNWYLEHTNTIEIDERYRQMDRWYTEDAGRSTIREVLALLAREPVEGK